MSAFHSLWVIVLAAGDGSRLSSLTVGHSGEIVPKQFCSLRGERTLLGDALERALAIAPAARVLAVVAEKHRLYWSGELDLLPPENVIVQPSNRGTAVGVLLPLLSILARDPEAAIAILPSDHHVREEAVLRIALLLAEQYAARHAGSICMLGLAPDSPSPDYGWIVPKPVHASPRHVDSFVEKPHAEYAEFLLQAGALWNSFILAGTGEAFLDLYQRRQPELLATLAAAQRVHPHIREGVLQRVYDELPSVDFSRDLLQGSEEHLRVLEVPPCGWTDLGTPKRVAECLRASHYGRLSPSLSDDTPVLYERLATIRRRARNARRQRARGA